MKPQMDKDKNEGKRKKVKGKSQGKPHLIKVVAASLFPFAFCLLPSYHLRASAVSIESNGTT
jgi:hypothetical protein